MKPTLEEIKDNYERVLLQLDNGHLAGIKKFSHSSDYCVVEQQDWINHGIHAIELEKGYKRESKYGYNIDRIKFLSDRNEVNEFMDYGSATDIADWDWDINNTQYDDQPDAYEYCVSSRSIGKSQKLEIFRKTFFEGVDNNNMMNGILEIYEEKQLRKIMPIVS